MAEGVVGILLLMLSCILIHTSMIISNLSKEMLAIVDDLDARVTDLENKI